MLIAILLAFQIAICVCLVGVVLLQRSEGGALGMGGGPSGFITARGAGNLLTQLTWGLFAAFLVLSLSLTLLSGRQRIGASVVDRVTVERIDPRALNKAPPPSTAPVQPSPAQPAQPGPLQAPEPILRSPFGAPPSDQSAPQP